MANAQPTKTRGNLRRFRVHPRAVLLATCLAAGSASAQPGGTPLTPAQQAAHAATQAMLEKFQTLRADTLELERRDAQAAIGAYQKFYEQEGWRNDGAAVVISSLIARLYYTQLHRKDKAMEIYDWAIKKFTRAPGVERLVAERAQVKSGTLAPETVKTGTAATVPSAVTSSSAVPSANLQPIADAPWQKWSVAAPASAVGSNSMTVKVPLVAQASVPVRKQWGQASVPVKNPTVALPTASLPTSPKVVGVASLPLLVKQGEGPGMGLNTGKPAGLSAQRSVGAASLPLLVNQGEGPGLGLKSAASPNALTVEPTNAILHRAILTQLKSGALTAEKAFTDSGLTAEVALGWINSKTLRWPDHADLANALIEQVNQLAPAKLERAALKTLPAENRVRIGDYFSAIRDERCLDIYRDVMAEPGTNGAVPEWYGPAGARVGAFYEVRGDNQKALAAFLDVVDKLPKDGGYGGYALMDAAALYVGLDQWQKAKELYEKIPQFRNKWLAVLAIDAQFNNLAFNGRHQEARNLIETELLQLKGHDLRAPLLWDLAQSYYITGEFDTAFRHCDGLIQNFPSTFPDSSRQFSNLLGGAKKMVQDIELWRKNVLVTQTTTVSLQLDGNNHGHAIISVRTFKRIPLALDCANVNLKLKIEDEKRAAMPINDVDVTRRIIVEAAPDLPVSQGMAHISVRNANSGELLTTLTVHVRKDSQIQVSPSRLFCAIAKGESAERTITLSAKKPFRVLSVVSNDRAAVIRPTLNQAASTHQFVVHLTCDGRSPFHEGTLSIKTDMPQEEVINTDFAILTR